MNFRTPTDQDLHTAFEQGEAAVKDLVHALATQIEERAPTLTKQGEALPAVQARLAKNSHNSSTPPSSDGYGQVKRTESLRKPGEKPNGGQPGHAGHTLSASARPERLETHRVETCAHCQASLVGIEAAGYAERQVCDIPARQSDVTAHRAEIKVCPECGKQNGGTFPDAVPHAVQYGPAVQTWASDFTNHHHIPVERTTEICADWVQHRVSAATVLKASEELCRRIEPSTDAVQEMLRHADVLPVDEAGRRVEGKVHGRHVARTERLTADEVHAKRGHEAMNVAGMRGAFRGTVVQDHWKPYLT